MCVNEDPALTKSFPMRFLRKIDFFLLGKGWPNFTLIFSKTALQLAITFERIELQSCAWSHFKAFFEYFRHMA